MIDKKNIYVIDDDPIFKLITRKILERQGKFSNMLFFENGLEGLTALKDVIKSGKGGIPGTILLDIEMPVMSGWDFMNEFVKIPFEFRKEIDVYIVSSSLTDDDKQKAANYYEIKEYITKPLTTEALNKIANF